MSENKPVYDPDELRKSLIDAAFGSGIESILRPVTEEKVDMISIKRALENDIFQLLAKYNISKDKCINVVAAFMQNLNRCV